MDRLDRHGTKRVQLASRRLLFLTDPGIWSLAAALAAGILEIGYWQNFPRGGGVPVAYLAGSALLAIVLATWSLNRRKTLRNLGITALILTGLALLGHGLLTLLAFGAALGGLIH